MLASDAEVLDLGELVFREGIMQVLEGNEVDLKDYNSVSLVYDLFIESLEEEIGTGYTIVKKNLPPPRKFDYPEGRYNGDPLCYIVRDTSCLDKLEYENMNEE